MGLLSDSTVLDLDAGTAGHADDRTEGIAGSSRV